jgi:hypothetical protein
MQNSQHNNTVLLVYPPGGYGTFVEWLLTYFSGKLLDSSLPFTSNGSSHRFIGNQLDFYIEKEKFSNYTPITTEEYLSREIVYPFARTHGQIADLAYDIKSYINSVIHAVDKIVLLTVPKDARLLVLGNSITKCRITYKGFANQVVNEFKDQFQVTNTVNVPHWQLREMMSYWHERRLDELHFNRYSEINDSKIINISIKNLVNNFEDTVIYLCNNLDIPVYDVDQLSTIRQHWLPLQKFVDSDKVCQEIINSVLDDTEYHWRPLHIIEEAFVQWQLRDLHHMDLLCYNLNEFPLSTRDLKKVLINV